MWAKKASIALPTRRAEPRQSSQATLFSQEIIFCLGDGPTPTFWSRNKTCRGQAEAGFEKLILSLWQGRRRLSSLKRFGKIRSNYCPSFQHSDSSEARMLLSLKRKKKHENTKNTQTTRSVGKIRSGRWLICLLGRDSLWLWDKGALGTSRAPWAAIFRHFRVTIHSCLCYKFMLARDTEMTEAKIWSCFWQNELGHEGFHESLVAIII